MIGNEAGVITYRDPDTVRGADVSYCSYKRVPRDSQERGFLAVAPELVVEVLGIDRTWKDAVEKAGEYLAMGVDRVWIVDPAKRRVHVFQADAAPKAVDVRAMLRDEAILPGFAVRVSEFFRD